MTIDFKLEIARIAYWKQLEVEYDPSAAEFWRAPKVAATAAQIARLKTLIGFDPPKDYCEFLSLANGWPLFLVETDLFGTEDFEKGRHRSAMERVELGPYIDGLGLRREEVVVIGKADRDVDIFLMVSPRAKTLANAVLWFAFEEVERFASFSEFFSAMVNHNADQANDAMREASE